MSQGMTANWALVHLERHSQMTLQQWWYQIYVALSRPRHHSRLAHHGPVPPELKRVMAIGPAPHIQAELARLDQLDLETRPKTHAAQRLMGWPQSGSELSKWRRNQLPPVKEHPASGKWYDSGTSEPLPTAANAAPPATVAGLSAASPPRGVHGGALLNKQSQRERAAHSASCSGFPADATPPPGAAAPAGQPNADAGASSAPPSAATRKVLTLHPPWAPAMHCGAKRVENRSWRTEELAFWLHCGKKVTGKDAATPEQIDFAKATAAAAGLQLPDTKDCLGKVLGLVRLRCIHAPKAGAAVRRSPWAEGRRRHSFVLTL
eukprot:gene1387-5848_t